MDHRLEAWIVEANATLSRAGVPHRQRPLRVLGEWSTFTGRSIAFNDPEARWIFTWYTENSKPHVHEMGSLYDGALFYDAEFWRVSVPIMYGRVALNLERSLSGMPEVIAKALLGDRHFRLEAIAVWADCIDYGLGIDDLEKTKALAQTPMTFLLAADKELRSTVRLLLEIPASQKSAETAAMAAEMFLKSFITAKTALTEDDVKKKYGHDLETGLKACLDLDPTSELSVIRGHLGVFPPVKARYTPGALAPNKLWAAYSVAQCIGATVVRTFSGRDCRPTLNVS